MRVAGSHFLENIVSILREVIPLKMKSTNSISSLGFVMFLLLRNRSKIRGLEKFASLLLISLYISPRERPNQ